MPNTSSVYYYHPNHLGSTCYVTDENATVQQGFLYAPFGEITNEYNQYFYYSHPYQVLPKYTFTAKELGLTFDHNLCREDWVAVRFAIYRDKSSPI